MKKPDLSELISLAIGKRSQNEFAKQAGLTPEYLNRIIKHPENYKPSVQTLKKIADASNGRVGLNRLMDCCGYEYGKDGEPDDHTEAVGKYYEAIESVKEYKKGTMTFRGVATRYETLYDILDMIAILYGNRQFRYEIEDDAEYNGRGRYGAERTANVTVEFATDEYICEFGFVIFYCRTEKNGVIFSDAAFDLVTMNEFNHKIGMKKLLEISTLPNQNRSAYQTVFCIEDTTD